MRLGIRRREHHDDLIDVGGNDPLALPAAGRAARERRPARQDLGDRPLASVASSRSSRTWSPTASFSRLRGGSHGVAPNRAVGALPVSFFFRRPRIDASCSPPSSSSTRQTPPVPLATVSRATSPRHRWLILVVAASRPTSARSAAWRRAAMSSSSTRFTSPSDIAPTRSRASSSVAAAREDSPTRGVLPASSRRCAPTARRAGTRPTRSAPRSIVVREDLDAVRESVGALERRRAIVHGHVAADGVRVALGVIGWRN